MRIIGGEFKGRIFNPPKNLPVRPTTDFAKTALFNILSNNFDFKDIRVLDLFSGTGSISLEFLSRGSLMLTSVDENNNCIRFQKEITDKLGLSKNFRTIKYDALKYLLNSKENWDIIFADPPFAFSMHEEIPRLVFENNLLKKDGWLILEHQSDAKFSEIPFFTETRKYGNIGFSIFKKLD